MAGATSTGGGSDGRGWRGGSGNDPGKSEGGAEQFGERGWEQHGQQGRVLELRIPGPGMRIPEVSTDFLFVVFLTCLTASAGRAGGAEHPSRDAR